jgi:hypothetical protein
VYYRGIGKQLLMVLMRNEGKCFVVIVCIWVELACIEDLLFWNCFVCQIMFAVG